MADDVATILIVDDRVDNLLVLTSLLKSHGYEVRKARGGQIALQTVQIEPPDLILLDIRMPEVSGYEVCAQLKANPVTQDIPIIFLSALNEIDDRMAAFAAGGADYITKPFHTAEVLARIHGQLTIQRQRQQLIEQNQRLQQEIQERQRIEQALRQANLELERLASLDSLTQISNRRRFDEYLSVEWRQAHRDQTYLSLILCDVDCFKAYNDHYGHHAGDSCLQQVAQAIHQTLHASDLVARYGGEEFAIVLPQTDIYQAILMAKRIQSRISELKIPHDCSFISPYLTVSLGIWSQIPDFAYTPATAIMAADTALYAAKAAGRNCWRCHDESQLLLPKASDSEEAIPAKS
ncbi:diguanylate cyclase [Leptolyngbya sp. NK1-12]|uniref:Diguanylate cyclase n=1 Tax=Leptolyngbya sp. NK1-12 TaxID=2547451 RepID=A0AA96WFU3_9CYAN|nr:diguanylate cyclase [Leptolyngbya sp. NK1-12]